MPFWSFGTVEAEPEVSLHSWQICEAQYADGSATRHFIGRNADTFGGRVSTAIQSFDLASRRGRTQSGRVYELLGGPGIDLDAEYVWNNWCAVNSVVVSTDVTGVVLGQTGQSPTWSEAQLEGMGPPG